MQDNVVEVPDEERGRPGWLCSSCLWKLCGCESYACLMDAAAPGGLPEERMGDCLQVWWPLCPASQLGWLQRSHSRSRQPLQSWVGAPGASLPFLWKGKKKCSYLKHHHHPPPVAILPADDILPWKAMSWERELNQKTKCYH